MDDETDNLDYAKTQVDEARRRLDSVIDRVSIKNDGPDFLPLDARNDEFVMGEDLNDIPDEYLKFVAVNAEHKNRDIDGHIQNIIIDCQLSIEIAVKSMYKAVDEEFKPTHDISFRSHETDRFNDSVPADFERKDEIIRAIFLTQFWERFYELAKYGAPALNIGPSFIFDTTDGERAISDAQFCVDLAEDFINHVED
ncbi:hypothetical protein U4E84_02735 [Halorubrum sp. AD140]|uniref:hypothetical protein n=1 Tax=Halorubrum sp. AD140 TaxID=3050073 RepID=UPI002ACCE65D|nr:hypothetical protein [Halorubrum sp. AD140]MDZ5810272.1 hypothetical protein [Halorubrum sp. AD140]